MVVPVHVHLGRGAARPTLLLLHEAHELSAQQRRGVSETVVHSWSQAISDPKSVQLTPPRKKPSLEVEGWLVARPGEVGREQHRLTSRPRSGDLCKVAFVFHAADAMGAVSRRVEFMWVQLMEVRASGWWLGALDNHPFVPGPLDAGSLVWLRADDLVSFEPAKRDSAG